MKKALVFIVLLAVPVVVAYAAFNKYQNSKPVAAVKQVNYHALYLVSNEQVKSLQNANATLKSELDQLNAQKQHFCQVLQQHKLADALCQ